MKYYLVAASLAGLLGVTGFRNKIKDGRYILNSSDLSRVDMPIYIETGEIKEISAKEAKALLK